MYWRLGDVSLTEEWGKIICRVIGEQNAEPRPGRVEVRWEWTPLPTTATTTTAALGGGGGGGGGDAVGNGISVARLVPGAEGKGKGKEEDEEDPFADVGSAPASPDPRGLQAWVDVPLVRRLVSGKYEAV